jgi:predicted nucleic acid-binding protein
MDFLLDANAFGDLMREDRTLQRQLASHSQTDRVIICPIVRGEVLHGIGRLPEGKRKKGLHEKAEILFQTIPCVAVPETAGDCYAQIKLTRQRIGVPMSENDLWIAATALALGAVLVTRDSDMQGIDGLRVEDWTKENSPQPEHEADPQ